MAVQVSGKTVVVMGLGRFGGGIGVTRWLIDQGARVTVTDQADAQTLQASLAQMENLPVTFRLGGHHAEDLAGCELLVVSPAVPKERSSFVQEAIRMGVPVSSEMNLFIEQCPARQIVGITGSAGKSTTTAMLGTILQWAAQAGCGPQTWVGGNIGHSLLADLERICPEDIVVLELSSFQLEDVASLAWSPGRALITNLKPNHLDRHGTMEAYAEAKMNIVRYQSPTDQVFVHAEEQALAQRVMSVGGAGRLCRYNFDPRFEQALQLPGRHNRTNAAAAIAVARSLGIDDETTYVGLSQFTGLPHRLAFVAERRGVRYYNDSKSTTPASAHLALESFHEPVILLLGGGDKGLSFDPLVQAASAQAKAVVCYGQTGPLLHERFHSISRESPSKCRLVSAGNLEKAIEAADELSAPGDVVLLSPACTSYDAFANYEQRGARFIELVRSLPE